MIPSLHLLLPEILVAAASVVLLVLDAACHVPGREACGRARALSLWLPMAGLIGAAAALLATLPSPGSPGTLAFFMSFDRLGQSFKLAVLLGGVLALPLSSDRHAREGTDCVAVHALWLLATGGMMVLVSAADLVTLFLGLELTSVPLYCLAASAPWDARSVEAGAKYLVVGSVASAILLFGLAITYAFAGLVGSGAGTSIPGIHEAIASRAGDLPPYVAAGGLLVMAGLLFKFSAVPFHMWTPDVYEGAPTPITAFMSVAVKATMAVVLLRAFPGMVLEALGLRGALWSVAAASMALGNVAALVQQDVRRMLAWSSIAHAGYILAGVLAATPGAQAAILYYAVAYTLANVVAFGVLVHLSTRAREVRTLDDLAGAGRGSPWAGVAMTAAMLSLIGMPPFAGFLAKFTVFQSAVDQGYVGLTVVALLSSAVSVGYYLRPLVAMFMREPDAPAEAPARPRPSVALVLLAASAALLLLGVLPGWILG